MRQNTLISALLALAVAAAAPAQAGLMDKVKKKTEAVRAKAEKVVGRAEAEVREKVGEAVGRAEAEVREKVGEAAERVEAEANEKAGEVAEQVAEAQQAVEQIHKGADGAQSAVRGGQRSLPTPDGFADGGAFFVAPRGVSSSADIVELLQGRKRAPAHGDYVELLRRRAHDAYYQFWGSWFGALEQLDTTIGILRDQKTRLDRFGATREASRVAQQIEALEDELRRRADAPLEHGTVLRSGATLALFGLNARSGAIPREVLVAASTQIIGLLDAAATRPDTEPEQQAIYALARDVTSLRDRLEQGDLAGAQEIMDRRWAWVMTP